MRNHSYRVYDKKRKEISMRKRFTLERMLRLLLTAVLYLGACTYVGLDMEILDNTVWSMIVTTTISVFLWLCWFGFSVYALFHLFDWVDSPTETEKEEKVMEMETLLRKHFPVKENQTGLGKK